MHADCTMAGADFAATRDGCGALAGYARPSVAGVVANGLDARNAGSDDGRLAQRWSRCGCGVGARDLVGAAVGVAGEGARDDGTDAACVSLVRGKKELRRGKLHCSALSRLIPAWGLGGVLLFWSKPEHDEIARFLDSQAGRDFSYTEVGQSRGPMPFGFTIDQNRVQLGKGADVFARAKAAICAWKMFEYPRVALCWPDTPIEPGRCVAVLVSHWGFWSLNAARIVYVIEEPGEVSRFGFAYGTLSDHAEIGEERFSVEWNHSDDSVWYDLRAFSRPGALAKCVYPLARRLQLEFGAESKKAMVRAVAPADDYAEAARVSARTRW